MNILKSILKKKLLLSVLFGGGGVSFFIILLVMMLMTIISGAAISGSSGLNGGGNGYIGGEMTEFARNEIPEQYIEIYKAAEAEYGVPWNMLAAHHRVETRFSTIDPMISPVGAIGHLQFMPCTWAGWSHPTCRGLGEGNISDSELTDLSIISQYGGYGVDGSGNGKADPWDIEDAIFSAANLLAANGAKDGDFERAAFAYNHSQEYVNEIISLMELYAVDYRPVSFVNNGDLGFSLPYRYDTSNIVVTSPYGMRNGVFHAGIDLTIPGIIPQSIHAVADGVVVFAGAQTSDLKTGYGYYVTIEHANGYVTRYGHLERIDVSVGNTVRQGTQIGIEGNTGRSSGRHLHFEIRRANDFGKGTSIDPASVYPSFK